MMRDYVNDHPPTLCDLSLSHQMSRRPLSVSPNPSQWTSQTNTLNVTTTTPRTQGTIRLEHKSLLLD